MIQNKWKTIRPSELLGIIAISFFAIIFTKCSVETISLFTDSAYTIAYITEAYSGSKLEHKIRYRYLVDGKVYTSGAERYKKITPNSRYILRYGKFAPNGNKLLEDIMIPDSIRQDTGVVWKNFLRIHHL